MMAQILLKTKKNEDLTFLTLFMPLRIQLATAIAIIQ